MEKLVRALAKAKGFTIEVFNEPGKKLLILLTKQNMTTGANSWNDVKELLENPKFHKNLNEYIKKHGS